MTDISKEAVAELAHKLDTFPVVLQPKQPTGRVELDELAAEPYAPYKPAWLNLKRTVTAWALAVPKGIGRGVGVTRQSVWPNWKRRVRGNRLRAPQT